MEHELENLRNGFCDSVKFLTETKDFNDNINVLVELLTNENDIVLDCFSGSGTTALACKELNRRFIGIELDKKYFDIAKERLSNE